MLVATWVWIAAAALLAAAIVVVVLSRRASSAGRPLMLVVTRFLALAYAGITLVGTIGVVIATLVSEAVEVALPVAQFWPEPFPWVTLDPAPAASVVGGGFATAEVVVAGLGADARLWLAAGHALQGVTFALIAGVIALLCHRMLRGSPFRPVLARSVMATAVTIAGGGLAWQLCFGIGGSIASHQVLGLTGWNASLPSEEIADYLFTRLGETGLPEATLAVSVEFWPLLLGLALAAVAIAFRRSERLQHDAEGLV